MDCIRDDLIFNAKMMKWEKETVDSISEKKREIVVKTIYTAFEWMPKPSNPRQADMILKFIDYQLEITMRNFDDGYNVVENGLVHLGQAFHTTAIYLRAYVYDETKVGEVLEMVVNIRKKNNERIESIVFDEEEMYLKTGINGEEKSDENAKLKIVDLLHILNIFIKNTFDKIHNAHRVKSLFT